MPGGAHLGGGNLAIRIVKRAGFEVQAGDFVVLVAYPVWIEEADGTLTAYPQSVDEQKQNTGEIVSAKEIPWNINLPTTQQSANQVGAGLALETALAADTRSILIQPDGRVQFPCDALTVQCEVGQYVALAQGVGETIDPAKVMVNATNSNFNAIGRLVERALVGQTYVVFDLAPAKTTRFEALG